MSMSCACDSESADGSNLPDGSLNSLTSPNGRPSLDDRTIVIKDIHDATDFESALEDVDGEQFLEAMTSLDEEADYESGVLSCGVPAEVFANNHDSSCHNGDNESEASDAESDEELDLESEEEDDDEESIDHDSADEYQTDEDSIESEGSEDPSVCSTSSQVTDSHSSLLSEASQHQLFLPWDVSPSVQSLKYEEDDESSDEEDVPQYSRRTYMIGNGRSGRPRMWDGCPSSISVSSNSSSSVNSCPPKNSDKVAKAGVSFSNHVTVYPVFETTVYPPSMVEKMYTQKDELRINKVRNKREFAYDHHSWRDATEEEDMEPNDLGEAVHPVHCVEKNPPAPLCRTRNVIQTYSSALGGYTVGNMNSTGMVHRAKRMRMYHP